MEANKFLSSGNTKINNNKTMESHLIKCKRNEEDGGPLLNLLSSGSMNFDNKKKVKVEKK